MHGHMNVKKPQILYVFLVQNADEEVSQFEQYKVDGLEGEVQKSCC
jgi:hypothetical protein